MSSTAAGAAACNRQELNPDSKPVWIIRQGIQIPCSCRLEKTNFLIDDIREAIRNEVIQFP